MSNVSSTGRLYYPFVHLLCLLLLAIPSGPYVRWIDVKGDVHTDALREVVEESPSELRVRLADGSERTVRMARVLELVREDEGKEEERTLLRARRSVKLDTRVDEARKTLDHLVQDGSEQWIREYAAAARAVLAERTREAGAEDRLRRFAEEYPRSRFQSECAVAVARLRAQRPGLSLTESLDQLRAGHERVVELDGPLVLRYRFLLDGTRLVLQTQPDTFARLLDGLRTLLQKEVGEDYGAYLLLEAHTKWAVLAENTHSANVEQEAGRQPFAALAGLKKLRNRTGLDLPEVRCDVEQELGRVALACGDKEGARGAWERARDLAPDPLRREAAEEALKKLAP